MQSLLAFLVFIFIVLRFCYGENETVDVVGSVECTDCSKNNIDISQTFAGLRVVISCKSASAISKTWGMISKLDERGKFIVSLPADHPEMRNNGETKENCVAKVFNALSERCLTQTRLEVSKIIFKKNGKQFFGQAEKKLTFSSIRCDKKLNMERPFLPEAYVVYIPRPPPLANFLNQQYPPGPPIPLPTPPRPAPYNMPIKEPIPPPETTTNHPSPPPIPAETLTPPLPSPGSTFNGPSPPPIPTETLTPPPASEPLPSQGSIFNGPSASPPVPIESSPTSEPFPLQGPLYNEPSLPPFPLL